MLVRARNAAAAGIVVDGIGPRALARLDAFERGYRRASIMVTVAGGTVRAAAYVARKCLRAGFRPFVLGPWRQRHKKDYLKRIPRPQLQ